MCSVDTYQPFEGRSLQGQCNPCPDRSTTNGFQNASNYAQCVCGENLYRASRAHAAGLDASGRLLDETYATGRPACQVRDRIRWLRRYPNVDLRPTAAACDLFLL